MCDQSGRSGHEGSDGVMVSYYGSVALFEYLTCFLRILVVISYKGNENNSTLQILNTLFGGTIRNLKGKYWKFNTIGYYWKLKKDMAFLFQSDFQIYFQDYCEINQLKMIFFTWIIQYFYLTLQI